MVDGINLHGWNPTRFVLLFVALDVVLDLGLAVFVPGCLSASPEETPKELLDPPFSIPEA